MWDDTLASREERCDRVCKILRNRSEWDIVGLRECGRGMDMLARFGRATVPPPGGDVIGRRRRDTHIHPIKYLGVEVELNGA